LAVEKNGRLTTVVKQTGAMSDLWKIATDTGGTFTDCWACRPDGVELRKKVLSSGKLRVRVTADYRLLAHDLPSKARFFRGWICEIAEHRCAVVDYDASTQRLVVVDGPVFSGEILVELSTGESAPVVGVRLLTETCLEESFPLLEFRASTTLATNALLEGKAAPTTLYVTRGFRDLLEIADQRRPELFALEHRKRPALTSRVLEVSDRLHVSGEVLEALELPSELAAGAVAISLLHSWQNPQHEQQLAAAFAPAEVSCSAQVAGEIGYLARTETAVVNASLQPVMGQFLAQIARSLPLDAKLDIMTSQGSLAPSSAFLPKDTLLSGPAGGVLAAAVLGRRTGRRRLLTLDMGGTSTDVARWDGELHYQFQQIVGQARILSPSLRIETVAAGGGSICHLGPEGLTVGPESAGASPGPACYGCGGPLTLTDVNLLLGRIDPERAAVPLFIAESRHRLQMLQQHLQAEGWPTRTDGELLNALLDIAIERMAAAVRKISVREGCDPADYTLIAFGGAGPQHACAVAERLGIREILVPKNAGLFSAWGAGQARREVTVSRQVLCPLAALVIPAEEMRAEARGKLSGSITEEWLAEVRLQGQETALILRFAAAADLPVLFANAYRQLYGCRPPQARALEVAAIRLVVGEATSASAEEKFGQNNTVGPQLIQDAFSTLVLDASWSAATGDGGTLLLQRTHDEVVSTPSLSLEVFRCRFEGLVDTMGAQLQRTAVSTNVKERLDFSCALLDVGGRLVMNAPHIPVHLGALGECVRQVVSRVTPQPGEIIVTNDPSCAGSHLPDVSVICPVFDAMGGLLGYTANRAHHAEIGGMVPGSMPPLAESLHQEGVLIRPQVLVRAGAMLEAEMRELLLAGPYPTRNVEDNIADLRAQVASAQAGATALQQLAAECGADRVRAELHRIIDTTANAFARKLLARGSWQVQRTEVFDDGWQVQVALRSDGQRLEVDFTGSSPQHPYSRNATSAVVRSAVLYVLRLWLNEDVSLNEGLMQAVELRIPVGFLNPEFTADPQQCPAVVAGNVETSQRLVSCLLKALEIQSDSQTTMNNVIFGNQQFGHYETLGGGAGAGPGYAGASALHTHMTNTAITDVEILERRYPVRIREFSIRKGSGGRGEWAGGDGLVREYVFDAPITVSFLTENRVTAPQGLQGGGDGLRGIQRLFSGGVWHDLGSSGTVQVTSGDVLRVETPGGAAYGEANDENT
jgi:5-oxoprolinase (ATP-hydrolysing)